MNVVFNIFGVLLVILSVLTFALTMIDGVAMIFSFAVLILSGLMALTGKIKYTLIVLLITTLNISSIAFLMTDKSQSKKIQEKELPSFLPPIPTPVIPVEDLKAFSKETGIPLETLENIPVTEETMDNKRSIFTKILFLLKLISVPYLITFILLFIGYRIKMKAII